MTTTPHQGVFPFFMSDEAAKKHGLKHGPAIADLIHRKTFQTAEVLDEIQKYGFMSAFEPCLEQLKSCNLEEFVIVCDTASTYGEMFLLLHKAMVIESFLSPAEEKMKAEEQEKEETERLRLETKKALLEREKPVYVFTPIIPKPYLSPTSDETALEVESMTVKDERPPIDLILYRPMELRKDKIANFQGSSALCGMLHASNAFEDKMVKCLQSDSSVQAIPNLNDGSSQTNVNRKLHKIIQYEPLKLEDFGLTRDSILPDVASSLKKVAPLIEGALQDNETVDIFADFLHVPSKSETSNLVNLDTDNAAVKEVRNFTDLDYSKGKVINCIDVHPTSPDIIAISTYEPGNIDDKIPKFGSSKAAYILLWQFSLQMHPMAILKAPIDCTVVRFNPSAPNILAGGLSNGQVGLWDLEKDQKSSNLELDDSSLPGDSYGKKLLIPVALSYPEHSHKRTVSDLAWLPAHIQINARGRLLPREHLTNISNQFFTVSGDGQVVFWDIRFRDIMAGNLPFIAKVKISKQVKSSSSIEGLSKEFPSTKWTPLFRIKPKRLEGTGELSFCKALQFVSDESNTRIICSSEEGELLSVDWSPKASNDGGEGGDKDVGRDFASQEYVQWMRKDHMRPCVGLSRSKFFPNFLISVSDWNFHIWQTDSSSDLPIFSSPYSSCHITSGQWSPTRPAVVFISKSNGSVDVWDFTESCYFPSSTLSIIPNQIASMTFISESEQSQLLAVGDVLGSLHIFELPRNLVKPFPREKESMHSFLLREGRCNPLFIEQTKKKEENVSSALLSTGKETKSANQGSEEGRVDMSSMNDTETKTNEMEECCALTDEEEAVYNQLEQEFLQR